MSVRMALFCCAVNRSFSKNRPTYVTSLGVEIVAGQKKTLSNYRYWRDRKLQTLFVQPVIRIEFYSVVKCTLMFL